MGGLGYLDCGTLYNVIFTHYLINKKKTVNKNSLYQDHEGLP